MPVALDEEIAQFIKGFPSSSDTVTTEPKKSPAPLSDAVSRFLEGFPSEPPAPPAPPPPPKPGFFDRFLSGAGDIARGVSEATGFSDITKLPENIRAIVGGLPKQLPAVPFSAEGISVAPDIEAPTSPTPSPDHRADLLKLLENWTIGPFTKGGRIFTEGRTEEQAKAFETMTPEQRAAYEESGRGKQSILNMERDDPRLQAIAAELLTLGMIGAGGHIVGGSRFGGPKTPIPFMPRPKPTPTELTQPGPPEMDIPPRPEAGPLPPGATIPPKPTGIPPELSDVASGQARAFLKPPAAEGTVPTAGEQAIRDLDLKQWAQENSVGYYKSRSGAEVVFDSNQLTQSTIKQLDKAGKLAEVVNGPGTSPKPTPKIDFIKQPPPEVIRYLPVRSGAKNWTETQILNAYKAAGIEPPYKPIEAVTARTPEGAEIRTVLTETPEQTRAAVEAQSPTTKVEVAPAAQAAPKIIQERVAGQLTTGKQPWEMTQQEYLFSQRQNRGRSEKFDAMRRDAHRADVEAAVLEGKPVPPEVLADYPDLAKGVAATPASPRPIEYQPGIVPEAQGVVGEVPPPVQPKATVGPTTQPAGIQLTFKDPQVTSRFADAATPSVRDYLSELGAKPANEANREVLNRIIGLESGGNPRAVNLKTKSGKDSGLFQFTPQNSKRFGVTEKSPVSDQVRAAEKRLAELPNEIGLDPAITGADRDRILTTAWLAPKQTRKALAAAKRERPTLIAGGAPQGAGVIAEAERTAGYSPLIEPRLQSRVSKEITEAVADYFVKEKIPFDPEKGRLFEQFAEFIETDKINFGRLDHILQSKGLTRQTLKEAFKEGATEAGRTLQPLSEAIKRLEQLDGTGKLPPDGKNALGFLRRLDNIRRGLQTSQLATIVRNIESQGIRVIEQGAVEGLNTLMAKGFLPESAAAQRGVLEAAGSPFKHLGSPIDSYRQTRAILSAHPKQETKLFGTIQSDLPAGIEPGEVGGATDKVLRGAEAVTRGILLPQKAQEFGFRSGAFLSKLEELLVASGEKRPLSEINPATIKKPLLEQAVQHAREMTFAAEPRTELGKALVTAVTRLPFLATGPVPYPRFMANAIQHIVDFSPAGFVKLLSPAERAKLAKGDMSLLSKATVGSAELLAAYQVEDSKYAGEHWYTKKPYPDDPDEKKRLVRWDIRPFGPLAAPFFIAHVVRKLQRGELDSLSANDIAQGLLGSTFRAGIGLYAIDNAIEAMRGAWSQGMSNEAKVRALKGWAADLIASYETPLRTIKDFFSEFDAEEAKQRARRTEPFMGPLKEAIPGVSQSLPELKSPTRAATPTREEPALRQLTGISSQTLNQAEAELAKHGFEYRNILPPQGHPEADQAMAKAMGPIVETALPSIIQSQGYQAMTRLQQKAALTETIEAIRKAATQQAHAGLRPEVAAELYLRRLPPHLRPLMQQSPEWKALMENIQKGSPQ